MHPQPFQSWQEVGRLVAVRLTACVGYMFLIKFAFFLKQKARELQYLFGVI